MKLKKSYVYLLLLVLLILVSLSFYLKKDEVLEIELIRLKIISNAIEKYYLDMMILPQDNTLIALIEPEKSQKWHGPYLPYKNIPKDTWGNDYIYKKRDNLCFQIYSSGINQINENGKIDDINLIYCLNE